MQNLDTEAKPSNSKLFVTPHNNRDTKCVRATKLYQEDGSWSESNACSEQGLHGKVY